MSLPIRSHTFSGQPLDRMDGERQLDPVDLASADLRVVPIIEGSALIADGGSPAVRILRAVEIEIVREREVTLLGRKDGLTWASVRLTRDEIEALTLDGSSRLVTIRSAGQMLDRTEAAILAYANALSSWQQRSRFCGACGAPAVLEHAGHRRRCSEPDCGEVQFPRTDPSVIGIVFHGEECLLVNQPQWPENRFATVAGFVEPGESLEEAMAREILEEVGLVATGMRYHSSQPWPFPMSLMIGFEVEVRSKDGLQLSEEIRSAVWLSRAELRKRLSAGTMGISTPLSISFALIAEWYGDREELVELTASHPW